MCINIFLDRFHFLVFNTFDWPTIQRFLDFTIQHFHEAVGIGMIVDSAVKRLKNPDYNRELDSDSRLNLRSCIWILDKNKLNLSSCIFGQTCNSIKNATREIHPHWSRGRGQGTYMGALGATNATSPFEHFYALLTLRKPTRTIFGVDLRNYRNLSAV